VQIVADRCSGRNPGATGFPAAEEAVERVGPSLPYPGWPPRGFARRCEGPVGIATHFFKMVFSILDSLSEESPRLRHQTVLLRHLRP
jgi:hypothetical protein